MVRDSRRKLYTFLMWSVLYFCQIWTKIGTVWKVLLKLPYIKFYEKLLIPTWVISSVQKDGRGYFNERSTEMMSDLELRSHYHTHSKVRPLGVNFTIVLKLVIYFGNIKYLFRYVRRNKLRLCMSEFSFNSCILEFF